MPPQYEQSPPIENSAPEQPAVPEPKKSSKKKILVIVVIVLLLAAVGALSYLLMQSNKENADLKAKQATIEKELKTAKSDLEAAKKEHEETTTKPSGGSSSSSSADTEREADIKALHGQIEAYYAQNGKYPTLANINDTTWRAANMKGLDSGALKDPDGSSDKLAAAPAKNVYAYTVTPANCNNTTEDCTGYTLTATKSNGTTYTKTNLN